MPATRGPASLPDDEEWVQLVVHVSSAALEGGLLTPEDIAEAAQDYVNETQASAG
jgi:hypothetical protein